MKKKLLTLLISFIFHLSNNVYLQSEEKISIYDCAKDNADHSKIISKFKKDQKVWIDTKAYFWLVEDLLFVTDCYKKIQKENEWHKNFYNLINDKIISYENIKNYVPKKKIMLNF